jgi:hypothetical protein
MENDMSTINWSFASPHRYKQHNKSYDGTIYYGANNGQNPTYTLAIHPDANSKLLNADFLSFGISENRCFVTTREKDVKYKVVCKNQGSKKTININSVDMLTKLIHKLTGVVPSKKVRAIHRVKLNKIDDAPFDIWEIKLHHTEKTNINWG